MGSARTFDLRLGMSVNKEGVGYRINLSPSRAFPSMDLWPGLQIGGLGPPLELLDGSRHEAGRWPGARSVSMSSGDESDQAWVPMSLTSEAFTWGHATGRSL